MLWHDVMHVSLAPEEVSYRLQSPLGRVSKAIESLACEPGDAARLWTNAVAALASAMAQNMQRQVRMGIVLSDRLVRYLVLPWQPGIVTRAEWRAYALNQFETVYGEVARNWRLRIELVPPGRPSLACAIDADMVDALREVAVANASRVVSIRPNFITVFNQRRALMRGSPLWFCLAEKRSICLGMQTDGVWRAVRNEPAPDGWLVALPGLVARVQVMVGEVSGGTIYVHAEDEAGAVPEMIGGLPLRVMEVTHHRRAAANAATTARA